MTIDFETLQPGQHLARRPPNAERLLPGVILAPRCRVACSARCRRHAASQRRTGDRRLVAHSRRAAAVGRLA